MSDGKDTVRLEDTDVVADDGTVDMAALSKSGHCAEDEPLLNGQTVSKAPTLWQRFVEWVLP